jgi:ketosteroid isomerase-like protein
MMRVVVALALASSGCAPASPKGLAEADRAAIRAVADSVEALFAAHRFEDGVALNFAEDAMTLQPNGPAVSGRAAIVGVLKSFPPFSEFKTEIQLLDGAGDVAYVHGTYSMAMTMPGDTAPTRDVGKYLEIWRRQGDGSWKVIRDMFNSDLPLPVAAIK